MREILFRGKKVDNGEWIYGCLLIDGVTGKYFIHMYGNCLNESDKVGQEGCLMFCAFEVDQETVCQYTGLTDKNKKKIWQGDIVKAGGNLAVHWSEQFASWCLSKKGWMHNHFFGEAVAPEDCEVIGNIFDNPELLDT